MHAHDLHGAFQGGARFALTRAAAAQAAHVFQKFAHADDAAGVGVGQQFVYVARAPALSGLDEGRAIVGRVQEGLEQVGDGDPADLVVQARDQARGPRRADCLVIVQTIARRPARL